MRKYALLILLVTLTFFTGCNKEEDAGIIEDIRTVKVQKLEKEKLPVELSYIGNLQSKDLKKYSFKTSAKAKSIKVKEGQYIKKGDVLVTLDQTDLNKAVEASKHQMEAAKAVYDKALKGASNEQINQANLKVKQAEDAYNFLLDSYEKSKVLLDEGVVSKQELDELKLQLDNANNNVLLAKEVLEEAKKGTSEEDKKAALAQYEQAKVGYEAQLNMKNDAILVSDTNGYVVDVLYKEGELIPAGYPVVVIRTESQVVNVGISQEDVSKVSIGTTASVKINEKIANGKVTNINKTLDKDTLTYNVEISLDESLKEEDFILGAIARVKFDIGEKESIWISIANIMNDMEDYVYIVEDNYVVRKNIKVTSIYEDKALVEGLEPGQDLIVKGMKSLKEGYKVVLED